jgi:hypothetical protein
MENDKLKTAVIKSREVVESAVRKMNCDIGLMVFGKDGGVGLVLGGDKGQFNGKALPFMREAAKRIQQVIAAYESGKVSLMDTASYHTYNKETGEFESSHKIEPAAPEGNSLN